MEVDQFDECILPEQRFSQLVDFFWLQLSPAFLLIFVLPLLPSLPSLLELVLSFVQLVPGNIDISWYKGTSSQAAARLTNSICSSSAAVSSFSAAELLLSFSSLLAQAATFILPSCIPRDKISFRVLSFNSCSDSSFLPVSDEC
nr:hypothetical protein Iba_chr06aCG6180 [Ipomoea batatas]